MPLTATQTEMLATLTAPKSVEMVTSFLEDIARRRFSALIVGRGLVNDALPVEGKVPPGRRRPRRRPYSLHKRLTRDREYRISTADLQSFMSWLTPWVSFRAEDRPALAMFLLKQKPAVASQVMSAAHSGASASPVLAPSQPPRPASTESAGSGPVDKRRHKQGDWVLMDDQAVPERPRKRSQDSSRWYVPEGETDSTADADSDPRLRRAKQSPAVSADVQYSPERHAIRGTYLWASAIAGTGIAAGIIGRSHSGIADSLLQPNIVTAQMHRVASVIEPSVARTPGVPKISRVRAVQASAGGSSSALTNTTTDQIAYWPVAVPEATSGAGNASPWVTDDTPGLSPIQPRVLASGRKGPRSYSTGEVPQPDQAGGSSMTADDYAGIGQITLVAPALRVASEQAEDRGIVASFDWGVLARGQSVLDIAGMEALRASLPDKAYAIYPALPPGQVPATASNLRLAPRLVQHLLGQGYGIQGSSLADRAVRSARAGTPPASPLAATIVPGKRPAGAYPSLLQGYQTGMKSPVSYAGSAQATRGGALDYVGMPVRLAPSLSGRSELRQAQAAADAQDMVTKTIRPGTFTALRRGLFPSFQSIEAEPDRSGWRRAAPAFGIPDPRPSAILGTAVRMPSVTPVLSMPRMGMSLPMAGWLAGASTAGTPHRVLSSFASTSSPIIPVLAPPTDAGDLYMPSPAMLPCNFGTREIMGGPIPIWTQMVQSAMHPLSGNTPWSTPVSPVRWPVAASPWMRPLSLEASLPFTMRGGPPSYMPNVVLHAGWPAIVPEPATETGSFVQQVSLPSGRWPFASGITPVSGSKTMYSLFPSAGIETMPDRTLAGIGTQIGRAVSRVIHGAPQMLYTPMSSARPAAARAVTVQRSTSSIASPASSGMRPDYRPKPTTGVKPEVNAANEINLLATEVWSLLKRRLSAEADRRGRW